MKYWNSHSGRPKARWAIGLSIVAILTLPVLALAGTGDFVPHPATPSFGTGASSDVALGDLDDDGDLDAVVANQYEQPETVWLNDGTGAFAAHHSTPTFGASHSYEVALGDLDGDSDLDAIVANYLRLYP